MIVRSEDRNDRVEHESDQNHIDQSKVETLTRSEEANDAPRPTRKKKVKPPSSADGLILPGDDNTRATIKAILEELWQLEGWDYNLNLDIKAVLEVMSLEGVNPLEVAKELVISGGAHPRTGTKYKNLRATFLNWCKLRVKWAKEKGNYAKTGGASSTRTAIAKDPDAADFFDEELRSRRRRASSD